MPNRGRRLDPSLLWGLLAGAVVTWAVLRTRRADVGRPLESSREREQDLRESEVPYRRLVESADDLIYTTDDKGHIVYANPAAKEALGGGEVTGRHFRELVREDYRDVADRFYGDQVSQRIPNTYCEFPMAGEGGRRVDRPADAARHGGRAHHRLPGHGPRHHGAQARASRRWIASARSFSRSWSTPRWPWPSSTARGTTSLTARSGSSTSGRRASPSSAAPSPRYPPVSATSTRTCWTARSRASS